MASKPPYGLLKFFRNEDYLDSFIDGTVHFSTPETYRLSREEGAGDADESASATYRRVRGDEDNWDVRVKNDDGTWTSIPEVRSITLRNNGHLDRWLHCWMELRIDESDDCLERFGCDLERMLAEFGRHFVFIPGKNVELFMTRLRDGAPEADLGLFKVKYSAEAHHLGPYCKRIEYRYQREVRIMLDECDDHEVAPRQIKIAQNFSDIVGKKPGIRISEDKPQGRVLTLTPEGTVEWSTQGDAE